MLGTQKDVHHLILVPMRNLPVVLAFAIATSSTLTVNSFLAPTSTSIRSKTFGLQATFPDEAIVLSRRTWIAVAAFCLSIPPANVASPANGAYIDPNRYGDKELQIALATKLRQNLRAAIVKDPKLAPFFVELSIQVALNAQSGPIVSAVENKDLRYAALELQEIRSRLKRTTDVTMADVVAFAGAEAIESLGGPKIVVQLGKLDDQDYSPLRIYDLENGPETIQAFRKSGLTEREVALLLGAVEAMKCVVDTLVDTVDMTNDNEMGDPQVDITTSFGAPSNIYGKPLGQLDNSVFESSLKSENGVWANGNVREWASRYAESGFFKDLPLAYSKLVRVGVESGTGEPVIW